MLLFELCKKVVDTKIWKLKSVRQNVSIQPEVNNFGKAKCRISSVTWTAHTLHTQFLSETKSYAGFSIFCIHTFYLET